MHDNNHDADNDQSSAPMQTQEGRRGEGRGGEDRVRGSSARRYLEMKGG